MGAANTIISLQSAIKEGLTSCVEQLDNYLAAIEKNKDLNAFLEVFEEEALQQAKKTDRKLRDGSAGKLAGLVIAIKDNLCYKDHQVSASSKILNGFTSLYNSTVVERLIAEDAIILGRLNCDEFAMGSSNENSAYGNVLNPIDKTKIPGGSSGGAAAAVKAGLCHAALGTDTGGSIRQPASLCDIVGLKPTYGRVSRHGCIAYASSFDQIGPMTNNVEDAALILEVIAGPDEYDSTLSTKEVPEYSKLLEIKGKKRIAYLNECINSEGLDPEIRSTMEASFEKLRKKGHTVEGVDFPFLDFLVPAYYVLTTAEASSNLARYDGIHYGHRSKEATDLDSTYKKSRSEGFGKEVKRRIMLGTFVLSAGYYDAYYSKAQKVRRIIKEKTEDILSAYDFIMIPTTPGTALKIGEKINDPVAMYLEDIFTVQANLAGLPSISLPLGQHSNGLPFGIQLIAGQMKEDALLAISEYLMANFRN
ncbi:MAG TPA: Asp-tRNA(Asn)/Glu-tRNA(Gln) amidotransferase subunit GatA [Flavobacteriales bacterium]|nr:Asp-tRNA(Asn)/Glu-tRNA(Gln) amidotransferase subunit GatA [Flavobacteriales bacterium]HIN39205.1 Asp-tRNA(Asn)/Glu-tRNA(Gln) amidotransferase subunit GatA [Flavobacteriales bacterium]